MNADVEYVITELESLSSQILDKKDNIFARLADRLRNSQPSPPSVPLNWEEVREALQLLKTYGDDFGGGLPHSSKVKTICTALKSLQALCQAQQEWMENVRKSYRRDFGHSEKCVYRPAGPCQCGHSEMLQRLSEVPSPSSLPNRKAEWQAEALRGAIIFLREYDYEHCPTDRQIGWDDAIKRLEKYRSSLLSQKAAETPDLGGKAGQ